MTAGRFSLEKKKIKAAWGINVTTHNFQQFIGKTKYKNCRK